MIIKSGGRADFPSNCISASSPASIISVLRGISMKPSARANPVMDPEPFPVEYALYPASFRTKWTR